jgi:ElaA protein
VPRTHPPVTFRLRTFEALTPRELHDALQLRTEVFIVEQKCAYQDVDGLDLRALHLLGYATPAADGKSVTGREPVTGGETETGREPVTGVEHAGGSGDGTPGTSPLLCYARLLPQGTSYPEHAAIGRVITKGTVRGTGLGRTLMLEALRQVDVAWGSPPLQLGAQDYAIPFYEALGFRTLDHRYLEDGIPHTTMERWRAPVEGASGVPRARTPSAP